MDRLKELIFIESKKIYFFGDSLYDYMISAFVFLISMIIFNLIIKRFLVILKNILHKMNTSIFELLIINLKKRLFHIGLIVSTLLASSYIDLDTQTLKIGKSFLTIYFSIVLILIATDFLDSYLSSENKDSKKLSIPTGIHTLIKSIIWIIGILVILSNIGVNINTFIAGLGIGGVAIALAAQNILGDLFNYFVILFDKPFTKGDVIQFNTNIGRVENIGIKSTKVRSSTGELLSVSNTDLTKSIVHNYQQATKKRNISIIGVEYETPYELVKKIPEILENAVKSIPNVEFQRVHCSNFNTSSIDFELVYFVLSNDIIEYADGVQKVNFAILDAFNKDGINFAYPAQRMIKDKQ